MTHTISTQTSIAALVATFLVFGVLGTAQVAAAYGGSHRSSLSDEDRALLQELRTDLREFIEEGDIDGARELIDESTLSDEAKDHFEERFDRMEQRAAIQAALLNNDYDAFVSLTEDALFADQVDSAFFEALRDAHELRMEGSYSEAREVLEEAGIERFHKGHKGDAQGPRGLR